MDFDSIMIGISQQEEAIEIVTRADIEQAASGLVWIGMAHMVP